MKKLPIYYLYIVALCIITLPIMANSDIAKMRIYLSKLIATKSLIAKEELRFQQEQSYLKERVESLKLKLTGLHKAIKQFEQNSQNLAKDRVELATKRQAYNDIKQLLEVKMNSYEAKMQELLSFIPPSFDSQLLQYKESFIKHKGDKKMAISRRLQHVISLLKQILLLQHSIHQFNEIKRDKSGKKYQVKTIYIGLYRGFFVNRQGDFSGMSYLSNGSFIDRVFDESFFNKYANNLLQDRSYEDWIDSINNHIMNAIAIHNEQKSADEMVWLPHFATKGK